MALANRWVSTRQLGLLLGFMGQRVLGQYDLALLSAESTPGKLLFVEENIRQTAKALDVPIEPFRTWIALHETTHAFEFEAHPVAPAVPRRAAGATAASCSRATRSRWAGRRSAALGRALRGEDTDAQHWLERMMSDEQRRLFRETQAVMSLLEGFGDHVMDEVGQGARPGRRADLARGSTRGASAGRRSSGRCSGSPGMDLKLEQYKKGERFVAGDPAARRAGGAAPAVGRTGDAARRREEIDDPARWVARWA